MNIDGKNKTKPRRDRNPSGAKSLIRSILCATHVISIFYRHHLPANN
jgi:hypothetical protein